MLSKYVLQNITLGECNNAYFHNIGAIVMVIKTIVFTIILKFNGPDGRHGYTQKTYLKYLVKG